ncbi:FYVE zinc finger-domain-containing protein [Pilobolus umbonatus]|nr:FYVE zinc finger-domain-containing protein [Pilobolus umbonatus]
MIEEGIEPNTDTHTTVSKASSQERNRDSEDSKDSSISNSTGSSQSADRPQSAQPDRPLPLLQFPQQSISTPNTPIESPNTRTTLDNNIIPPRSQRVWEMDRQAPECRRCHRRFSFLVRRHHCRRCGQIVCDKCSSHRIKLPVDELIEDPMIPYSQYPSIVTQYQRVCDMCYLQPIRRVNDHRRTSARNRPVPFIMRRSDSSQSLMNECPVCGYSLLGISGAEQEQHLHRCLNIGSPPVHPPRYIVYELSEDSTQIGDECPICFDEFEKGDKIARMLCLCSYHQHCLSSWLQRGKGCPVHYDSLQV